jgi:hypothetical protein
MGLAAGRSEVTSVTNAGRGSLYFLQNDSGNVSVDAPLLRLRTPAGPPLHSYPCIVGVRDGASRETTQSRWPEDGRVYTDGANSCILISSPRMEHNQ